MTHINNPIWSGWEPVLKPAPIIFKRASSEHEDILINGKRVGWIERRPFYCDRGHWKFGCELPDIDAADSFPRYYFDLNHAKAEIVAFYRWRLWRL